MESTRSDTPVLPTNSSDRDSSEISTNINGSQQYEERLARTWRHLISSVFSATSKAEQVVSTTASTDVASIKEIDETVVAFLRARLEWGRTISYLEAKVEGKAKEIEVLQHYVRTQPCLGTRKRKRVVTSEDKSPIANANQEMGSPAK